MNTANSVYELQIIKKVIANHLDRTLPSDANQALYLIQHQIDDLVWNISTSIYQRSGCKVDFSLVRDLTNARIESLKMLSIKQAEEARQKALAEEKRKIEEARLKIEAEVRQKAEQARLKAEEEARIRAEEDRLKAIEGAKRLKEMCIKVREEIFQIITGDEAENFEDLYSRMIEITDSMNIDNHSDLQCIIKNTKSFLEDLNALFNRIKEIIVYESGVESKLIRMNSRIENLLEVDWQELYKLEFVFAIEEEFDIEIPDQASEILLQQTVGTIMNYIYDETGGQLVNVP